MTVTKPQLESYQW